MPDDSVARTVTQDDPTTAGDATPPSGLVETYCRAVLLANGAAE